MKNKLTWKYNDYQCDEYINGQLNEIIYFARTDNNDNVIDLLTGNKLEDSGSVVTIEQSKNLKTKLGEPNYKVVNGVVKTRTNAEKLTGIKKLKDSILKNQFTFDTNWAKEAYISYKMHKEIINDTTRDTWWAKVKTFWQEARVERESNKANLQSASSESAINAIEYNPTHVKVRNELEN